MINKIKILEAKVKILEKKLDAVSSVFNKAFYYLQTDPAGSLNKTRIVMEKILHDIYKREMLKDPKKSMLGEMLNDNQFTEKIEKRILGRIHTIRVMSNLGSHGEVVNKEDAVDILDNLIHVLIWYFEKYQNMSFAFDQSEIKNSKLEKKHFEEDDNNLFVDDRDGMHYETKYFGNRIWFTQDFNFNIGNGCKAPRD